MAAHEMVFVVEEDPDCGLRARAVGGEYLVVEAADLEQLWRSIRDAVEEHFDEPHCRPRFLRLHLNDWNF